MTPTQFEVPKEVRDMAEKNVEQAQAAFRQFSEAITQAMGMWSKAIPANDMTAGFKQVQDRAIGFAKQNAETGLALAADLAKVKDFKEVLALQTKFAQTQMQAYAQQTQELGKSMTAAMTSLTPKS